MARVCLIYPRDIGLNFFPLGIGYIAAYLAQKGHQVRILDITQSELKLLLELPRSEVDIIGLSITTPQLALAQNIIHLLREHFPGTPIVVGGIHPSYFKETFLDENDADYLVYGEGEVTMDELCQAIDRGGTQIKDIQGVVYRQGSKSVINPPRPVIGDINQLPLPLREAVNYSAYLQPPGLIRGIWTQRCANLTTSRGCPGQCSYCGVNYIYGRRYRRRSVDNVLAEIDILVERYNVDGLYFMDDTFLLNTNWVEEFCHKLVQRNYCLRWSCYGRVDTIRESMIEAAKQAGCVQIEFGIESGSPAILKRIKKGTSLEQIQAAVNMAHDHGIRALGSFIIGFAEDTEEECQETVELAGKLGLDFTTCYYATPYPGSQIYEEAVKNDCLLEHDFSKWYVRTPNIWRVKLTPEKLVKNRLALLKSCRLRNSIFFMRSPSLMFRMAWLLATHPVALARSILDSMRNRCFDDLGYYFYTHLEGGLGGRNL
ncbi:hypothetical protein AAU61_01060 [Desulfocarbo indianensis]|nr:hypothetical protein AAU61_01060 [Desulfocarbo indianensis]